MVGVLQEASPTWAGSRALQCELGRHRCVLRAAEAVAPALAVEVTAVDVHGGIEMIAQLPSLQASRMAV